MKNDKFKTELTPLIDDIYPHYLQASIINGYANWDECIRNCNIHKLCYKRISIKQFIDFKQQSQNSELF